MAAGAGAAALVSSAATSPSMDADDAAAFASSTKPGLSRVLAERRTTFRGFAAAGASFGSSVGFSGFSSSLLMS